MPEQHLFILWENARNKEKEILEEIKTQFKILKEYEIEWKRENYKKNLSVLYGHDIFDENFLEKDRGFGSFLCVIVEDENPIYGEISTLRGTEQVNLNCYNLKNDLRNKYCNAGYSIHSSLSEKEMRHDFAVLFGMSLSDFMYNLPSIGSQREYLTNDTVSVEGWKNLEQVFYILNETIDYVVLRNFEDLPNNYKIDEHKDIDILVDNVQAFCHLMQPLSNLKENAFPLTCFVKVGNDVVPFHKKFPLDGYYDYKFSKRLIKEKVLNSKNIYVPSDEMYFYSLLFHVYYHKNYVSNTYKEKFKDLTQKLFGKEFIPTKQYLNKWLNENNYKHSICADCLLNNKKQVQNIIKFNPCNEELYYYDSGIYGSLIFHKKMFSLNPIFLTQQMRNFSIFFNLEQHILVPQHPLYKKYIKRVKKGEYLWFFKARCGKIMQTTYYENKKQVGYIKRKFLLNDIKASNDYVDVIPDRTRILYYGNSIQENFSEIIDFNELIAQLDKFILFVFKKYKTNRENILSPQAFDALPFNCIVDCQDDYNFIDSEFRLKGGIHKSFYIWRLCADEHLKIKSKFNRKELYGYLCDKYKLPNFYDAYCDLQKKIHYNILATPIEIFFENSNLDWNNPLKYKENIYCKNKWKNKASTKLIIIKLIKIFSLILIFKNLRKKVRSFLIMKLVFPYQELYELYFNLKNKQRL